MSRRTLSPRTIEALRTILFVHENPAEVKIEGGRVVVIEIRRKAVSKENPEQE
jgi:hypothetical protein